MYIYNIYIYIYICFVFDLATNWAFKFLKCLLASRVVPKKVAVIPRLCTT